MVTIGLAVITLAWAIQLLTFGKQKRFSPLFLIFYILGVMVLVVDSYNQRMFYQGLLHVSSVVLAVLVMWKVIND
jgi:hypothetical protein